MWCNVTRPIVQCADISPPSQRARPSSRRWYYRYSFSVPLRVGDWVGQQYLWATTADISEHWLVAHMWLCIIRCLGSVSGQPHSKWWWFHDISFPLLASEHSMCKAPWSGTPCRTTFARSRTMSPLDSTRKPGFSLATSVLNALETSQQLRYINSHLPYHDLW